MSILFERVSIRKFEEREVEQEKIESLLRAAMAAPSARNQQPWEFYVVKDAVVRGKLSEASEFATPAKNAPLAIVACYRKESKSPVYSLVDMGAAVENLLLRATELGLGACWIGVAPRPDRMEIVGNVLQLPDHLAAFATIAVGYPAEERKQQDRFDETRIHYL